MLLVASETELPPREHVWGTGGWLPPAEREALDWLTLARLSGWGVTVTWRTGRGVDGELSGGNRWIVLACDPDSLDEEIVRRLAGRLEAAPLLIVARAGTADHPFTRLSGVARRPDRIGGRSLGWLGPGAKRSWSCEKPLEAAALELSAKATAWATLDGAPVIAARRVGRGVVAMLGFHPSEARDRDGAGTSLLKHLLIWGAGAPVAWHELEDSLVLRMDDPGGAQNVHLRSWCYPKLGEAQWADVGALLAERNARMSIAYVAGWVDDGDTSRGELTVAGRPPDRLAGRVYPSPVVKYHDRAGHAPGTIHDYEAEFRGIQALRGAGLVEVELHGYTHIHPDSASWAKALDRYEATRWFREFGRGAEPTIASLPPEHRPLTLGVAALRRFFGVAPTTLICPGDEFTERVLERALGLGFSLVGSYYLALRHRDRFCWSTHVCAPYLDEPDARWFTSGLPVVGYFHDRDLAREGADWLARWLDQWRAAGARRLIDFRELAAGLGRRLSIEGPADDTELVVTSEDAPALVRPLPIAVRYPGGRAPTRLSVDLDGGREQLPVDCVDGELGRLMLTAWTSSSTEHRTARGARDRSSPSGGAAPAPV
jgi:hypothetical protein